MSDILEKLIELIRGIDGNLVTATISEDTSLWDDLGFDSLDVVELVMAIEEEYDIEIPDDSIYASFGGKVGEVAAYIEKERKQ